MNREEILELSEELLGTCGSLNDVLAERGLEFDDLTPDNHALLAEYVVLCSTCDWWVDAYEVDDDHNCEDCREENE